MEDPQFLKHFPTEDIYLIDSAGNSPVAPVIKRKFLIVAPPLSEEDRLFLSKVFASVEVTPEMLTISENDSELQTHTMAFYFGKQPQGKAIEPYQKTTVKDCMVVTAHRLSEIAEDKTKKRKLWQALKSSFS